MNDIYVGDNDHGDRTPSTDVLLQMIKQLRTERDEARREVLEGMHPDLRHGYAAAREWDCFKSVTESYEKIANKYHTTFQKLAQEESTNEN